MNQKSFLTIFLVLAVFVILFCPIKGISQCCAVAKDSESDSTAAEVDSVETEEEPKIKVTFVELGSVGCIPCDKMQPIMKEITEEYGDQVEVIFYDVRKHKNKKYAQEYRVRVIPTQVFLNERGQEYHRHIGFYPKEKVLEALENGGVEIKEYKEKDKDG